MRRMPQLLDIDCRNGKSANNMHYGQSRSCRWKRDSFLWIWDVLLQWQWTVYELLALSTDRRVVLDIYIISSFPSDAFNSQRWRATTDSSLDIRLRILLKRNRTDIHRRLFADLYVPISGNYICHRACVGEGRRRLRIMLEQILFETRLRVSGFGII